MRNKKAQVTIFVIIALIIVIAVLFLFFFFRNNLKTKEIIENPQAYIQECLEKSLINTEEKIIINNGYINKAGENSYMYNGEKIPFFCKASEFYIPCVNQEPALLSKIRKDIKEDISNDLEICFNNIKEQFESQGYKVEINNMNETIELRENEINIIINKLMNIEKEDKTTTIKVFRATLNSPLYNLFNTAREIINFESTLCEFNEINWMKNYPDIKINKFKAGDGTLVYILTDRATEKQIKFAIRGCLIPAGV